LHEFTWTLAKVGRQASGRKTPIVCFATKAEKNQRRKWKMERQGAAENF
jgi:hypothetical protein